MTERLADLLREEAQALEIHIPPASDVLGAGRSLRRRRGYVAGLVVASIIGVATAGSMFAADRLADSGSDSSPTSIFGEDGVFSIDHTVHLGGAGAPTVTLKEDIHSLHYTSEGVLVRTNLRGGASDGSGPEHFTLIRPDGSTIEVSVTTEGIVVSTDADQPYLAYSETDSDGNVQVVLHDVASDEEAARVNVPGTHSGTGWPSPPVSLDDDTVYVGFPGPAVAVDWRTGESRTADHVGGSFVEVYGGRTTGYEQLEKPDFRTGTAGRALTTVIDANTGEVLLSAEISSQDGFSLSPDGRFAILAVLGDNLDDPYVLPETWEIHDLESGDTLTIDISELPSGWTPSGAMFRLEGDELLTCDASTGDCSSQPSGVEELDGSEHLRFGGTLYES